VLPADVNFCEGGVLGAGPCINDKVCAYHGSFASRGNVVLYAAQATRPLRDGSLLFSDPKGDCVVDNTSAIQMPNGDPADLAIDGLSHEYSETILEVVRYRH